MNYNYYIIDVFTREVFNGAQIGVFPNADGLSDRQMQKIANELNLWETVFVLNAEAGDARSRKIRIFSPNAEIDFAGHPIIATAYVLTLFGNLKAEDGVMPIVFEQNAGPIHANVTLEQGKPVFVQYTAKVSSIIDRFAPSDAELADFLSIQQSEIDHLKYSARLVACDIPYLVVPVWKYETVRKARFNYASWSQSAAPQTAAQEIMLFAPKTPFPDSDFNIRLLGPRIGPDEDPPVGSALPAFASYLCSFEHIRKGTHTFAVDRGGASSRRSILNVEMDHKGKSELTLRVGGSAILFAQGTVFLS